MTFSHVAERTYVPLSVGLIVTVLASGHLRNRAGPLSKKCNDIDIDGSNASGLFQTNLRPVQGVVRRGEDVV